MIGKILDTLVVVLTAVLLLIAAIGGIDATLGPLHVRAQEWTRPLALLMVCLGLRAWASTRVRRLDAAPAAPLAPAAPASVVHYVATRGMLGLLLAIVGVYAHYHIRVAGGLDSYGYVSAAHLIASGRLHEAQPLAAVLPFDNPIHAVAPLGHVAAADGKTSVPRFPLGLPAMMAVALLVGAAGPFFVPMAMACAAIALTYLIVRQRFNVVAGLFAATLVAADPTFAAYAIQPMSDVPAAGWLLAAVWFVFRGHGVAGGICSGMAFLTRPALLPAVVVLVFVMGGRHGRSRSTIALTAIVIAALLLQLLGNASLYGGVAASGYGSTGHLFELSGARLWSAIYNFGKWLTFSHTALFWLLWPGALLILRRDRWAWEVSAVATAAALPYLFYIVFDDWESTRFLLPSIVLVLILSTVALRQLLPHPLLLFAIALTCAAVSHRFLEREGIYRLPTLEAKYALVGDWFKKNTSERVVVLAALHSGTIRLYGERQTIRWDQIPEHALAATIRNLISAGYEPYLALDLPSEPPMFDERFATQPVNTQQIARVRVVNIYRFVSAY